MHTILMKVYVSGMLAVMTAITTLVGLNDSPVEFIFCSVSSGMAIFVVGGMLYVQNEGFASSPARINAFYLSMMQQLRRTYIGWRTRLREYAHEYGLSHAHYSH